jgi:hypothetical protein
MPELLLPVVVPLAGFVTATGVLAVNTVRWMRGRSVPPVTWMVAAFGAGLLVGPLLISLAPDELVLAVVIGPGLIVVAWDALRTKRYAFYGALLVGAGLPGMLWWGWFVMEDVLDLSVRYDPILAGWFVLPTLLVLAGVAGIAMGDRVPPPPPRIPADQPDPSRAVALAGAIQSELQAGPVSMPHLVAFSVALLAGLAVRIGGDLLRIPWSWFGWIPAGLVFAFLATEIFYRMWPERVARAEAAHAVQGSWELHRWRAMTHDPPPISLQMAREWLARHPETDENRWVRPELLAWIDQFDEARAAIERMPGDTDEERFNQHALRVHVDLVEGRPADIDGLVAAAEEVGDEGSEARMRAISSAAIARARQRWAVGEDWMEPLVEAQARIGSESLGILRRDTWMRRFRSCLVLAGMLIAIPVALELLVPA